MEYKILFLLSAIFVIKNSFGNLVNFRRAIICHLGFDALVYNGYGCWCGPGGDGEPLDGIDSCCKMHDSCYDESGCGVMEMYVTSDYHWTCGITNFNEYMRNLAQHHWPKIGNFWLTHRKVPMSEMELNELVELHQTNGTCLLQRPDISCSAKNEGCHKKLCECDKIAVECFAKFEKPEVKPECPISKEVRLAAWTNKKWAELQKQEKFEE